MQQNLSHREIEFYNVYRDADPALYEILMDTLDQMWAIRETARQNGMHVLNVDNNGQYYKLRHLAYGVDWECGIKLRYYGEADNHIEDMAYKYGWDYEEVYRLIADRNHKYPLSFDEAFWWVDGYLSESVFFKRLKPPPLK